MLKQMVCILLFPVICMDAISKSNQANTYQNIVQAAELFCSNKKVIGASSVIAGLGLTLGAVIWLGTKKGETVLKKAHISPFKAKLAVGAFGALLSSACVFPPLLPYALLIPVACGCYTVIDYANDSLLKKLQEEKNSQSISTTAQSKGSWCERFYSSLREIPSLLPNWNSIRRTRFLGRDNKGQFNITEKDKGFAVTLFTVVTCAALFAHKDPIKFFLVNKWSRLGFNNR